MAAVGHRRLWWTTAAVGAVGVALAAPEWAPIALTREDGPVETGGFACFLAGAVLAFVSAVRARPERQTVLAAAGLGLILFVAAGEEVSWGQRVFDTETPAVLVDGNAQDELNLHNLEAVQHKAVIAQLAIAGGGVLLPFVVRRPWARAGFPFFAAYLAYRSSRAIGVLAGWGPAGRNSEAAELLLALGLLALTAVLARELRRPRRGRHPSRLDAGRVLHEAPAPTSA